MKKVLALVLAAIMVFAVASLAMAEGGKTLPRITLIERARRDVKKLARKK